MVNAKIVSFDSSIPIILGANIGTTAINAIAAFGQAQETEMSKLEMATATIHDFVDSLSLMVLFPKAEVAIADLTVARIKQDREAEGFKPFYVTITEPFVSGIIQVCSEQMKANQ